MNIFITYSDEKYAPARHFCARMARIAGGFDKVMEYCPDDLDEEFRNAQAKTLSVKRGAGLWVWKPYVIQKTLNEIAKEGDVVFYADAGCFFIRSCRNIIRTMDEDIWISDMPLVEKQYTKREVFVRMGCEGTEYEDTPQLQATFIGIRKSKQSCDLIKEWYDLVCDYTLLSPDNNPAYPEADYFLSHREDQSILSLLLKKHGIKPHLDPTQYGKFPEKYLRPYNIRTDNHHDKEYSPSILLYRRANVDVRRILNQLLHVILPKRVVRMFLAKECYEGPAQS